ncbi:unnamed protein product [Blepharisma stoltei]|uniref:Uncharacterized protein n=1 Tax=Blepharisma stoltei TaxID=1481888 RepID=A0AAU9IZ50_9CILI|nr:unnamed protein product [Blepharisma stoltei]
MQQRILPATQQIAQIEDRIQYIGGLLLDNVKASQILRSNFTTLMHDNKKLRDDLNTEIIDEVESLRGKLNELSNDQYQVFNEIDEEIHYLKNEKRKIADGIMLLDRQIESNENIFGSSCPTPDLEGQW